MTREKAFYLRSLIEKAVESFDDKTALTGVELFPRWRVGITYTADDVGKRFTHDGVLYVVRQPHTTQETWLPGAVGTESLYARVAEEDEGTIDNPIAYDGNMALENGKYYIQNGIVYRCTRDTVNPVYNALADLVGIYVEVVK